MPASSPPPAPTRPLPFLPDVALPAASSASLILPRSPASEEPGSPPLLVRSNTVGLHPAPVPLDIDFKGRLVRARNSQPVPSSSTSSPSLTLSSSPGSSRFSDWHPPVGSRKSSDTSVTVSTQDHDDPLRPPQPPKASGGLYALAASERRGVESAVDVLAIVEEDEAPFTGAPALRAKRSPSKRGPGDSPRRRYSAGSAGTKKPSSPLASELADETAILIVPRTRARAPPAGEATPSNPTGKPTYPFRLSTADRSFSAGAALEPTSSERDELGLHQPLPLPQPSFAALTPPRAGPRAGKRCLSELERSSASRERDDAYGLVGLGLPSSLGDGTAAGRRTRHESFAREGDEEASVAAHGEYRQRRASRRVSSGTATRTKLVLREKGKPVLTYQLGECIGRGQFGSVYRALNLNTGQVVAVKRILLEGKTDAEVDQLSNEVALLQRLSHPSVVKYEGVVRTEHYLNIILEYVENGSLSAILKQFGQLPEGLVASYTVKILEGLAYLHQQNVVHCDLKAANLLSTKNGNIKLSDFGVSLNLNAIKATRGFNATTNEANGTPNWMAPEVISLKGALPASDIWSLAATIVELIDGRPPYSDLVAMSAMFRIVEDPAGPPIPDRCSPELQAFLARCFKKIPEERPTADELFEDPWLLKHFDFPQDMRPQDSLPFLRRISTEYRRAPLVPSFSPAEAVVESPLPLEPPVPPFAAKEEPRGRPSFDSGYSGSDERGLVTIHATEETHRSHTFIRSSFSKAIDCKICGESTKRHAVLCTSCGLISHARCKEFAPVCDLRTQLFGPSASSTQPLPPFARFPTMPSSTSSSPSSFAITDLLPFSKARRAKSPTPTSSETHLPLQTVANRTSSAGEAIRQLSHALLPSKSRTPDSTPPSSLGRTAPAPPPVTSSPLKGRPHSLSVSVPVPRLKTATSAIPAVPPTSPVSASPKDPHSIDLRAARHVSIDAATAANVGAPLQRRSSRCNVVFQSGGTRALGRKKSHGRSVSQPVVGLKNAVSDTDNSRVHGEAGLPAKGECVLM
ncbi:hypothetical protein Rhopal_004875-T1 [Rhodotorula paludigena]|uniref:Uncharacterized protein n=1 Tax=Rhodotorula paludigena TaxID=86838 RepID=A0AAV5GS30_9BASI|nr:hypothetical protein Rhopal_004875-T1 [Rhodotorula paludigena]